MMPNSEGDLPLMGAEAAEMIFCFTSRTVLSPVNRPPVVVVLPDASVFVDDRCLGGDFSEDFVQGCRPAHRRLC